MEERSQGAVEYLMMLAAVLVVVGGIVYSLFSTSEGLQDTVQTQIDAIKDNVIDSLTSIAGA